MRAREEKAIAAQEAKIANHPLPPPRDADGGASRTTEAVLEHVKAGGKESTAELLTELQRQMVEAERWRGGASDPGSSASSSAPALEAKCA